mmetsp:Transcript_40821/g.66192  ORF Transcript_40821/g.66192 Transcript_40821/m.66192 type:complete len:306 (+) Transcript_40821:116-1033(+)|eukprot:CAMPEP_0184657486 /NCGR_PEP_ID=MMETSP0308-20130426/20018_1 /TAXON_ID=38269 /ORGANISM="Gloeochaete witrockiana, Strain SAG 46.84" /LENGTH=305 /DNA_ID=CAMNT_0027095375 /DNA_START=65 /DNA_END=982 /DNA_ORIENTATION=-
MSYDASVILEKLRRELKNRGAEGILGLGKHFRIVDDDKSMDLDYDEFKECLRINKLLLPEGQLHTLFRAFDDDNTGAVSYTEFLRDLRGEPSLRRKALIAKAFRILDVDNSGVLNLDEIKTIYNARYHPKVKSGEITEDEALTQWLNNFEPYGDKDGKVTAAEWNAYYSDISASIDTDDYFSYMMEQAWRFKETDIPVDPKKLDTVEEILKEKLFQLTRNPNDERGLIKAFKYYDLANSGTATIPEFNRTLERFGIILKRDELAALFSRYDVDGNGTIDYEQFAQTIAGKNEPMFAVKGIAPPVA